MERHSFSFRRRTIINQCLPADIVPKVVSFVMHIRKLSKTHSYDLGDIGNADKTPCWVEMPGQTIVEHCRKKSVSTISTGHEKSHFTVMLLATKPIYGSGLVRLLSLSDGYILHHRYETNICTFACYLLSG